MTRRKFLVASAALGGALVLGDRQSSMWAATPASVPPDVVMDWNVVAIDTLPSSVVGPPQARFLGIVHAAIYDAVNAIDRRHGVYQVDIKAPPGASMEAAAAAAGHGALVRLFPLQQAALDAALDRSLKAIPDGQAKTDGVAVGKEAAEKTVAAHANDGSTAQVPYTPGTSPASWQPTMPFFFPARLTQWGAVKPFMLNSGDQFAPPGPLSVRSAAYAKDVEEVRRLGSVNSATRTSEQAAIAIFWTTSTSIPFNEVARQMIRARGTSLADSARLFALLHMITSDSQIAVWASKYKYNLLRPVTTIRNAAALGNSAIAPDPNWESLIITPAHPDYPSGHAGFGGAAVKVLQTLFGTDEVKADVIYPVGFGVTRHWRSFSEITKEIDNARVWGGIHTRTADAHASALGRNVAEYSLASFLRPV